MLLGSALAVALPLSSAAQEPQPWTNTGAFGARVVPALPADEEHAAVVRADGGAGSTGPFKLSNTRLDDEDGDESSATFLAGRTGISYGWRDFDVFVTSHAYRVTIPGAKRASGQTRIVASPYTQAGDVAVGARWARRVGGPFHAGVEGGAVFLGASGTEGETDVVLAGPNTAATSPFARGLLTWRGLGPEPQNPRLTATLNLGYVNDRSWEIWKAAVESKDLDDETLDHPFLEERVAMGFYGEEGAVHRVLFGASVAWDAARMVRPFLELSGESTAPDLTLRLTPGVTVRPSERMPLALFLSADLDLSGAELEASPLAPAARVNAGLQLSFLSRSAASRRPMPIATPRPPRNGASRGGWLSVKVEDENKRPVVGARVRVISPTNELLTKDDYYLTNDAGVVTLPLLEAARDEELRRITVRHEDFVEWRPLDWPKSMSSAPTVTMYRQKVRVLPQFVNRGVAGWKPPPGTELVFKPQSATKRERTFRVPVEDILLPAHESFGAWTIELNMDGFTKPQPQLVRFPSQGQWALKIYVDTEKNCAEFSADAGCGAAPPAPTPTPAVSAEKLTFAVFGGDSADVRPEEAARLLQKLQAHMAKGPLAPANHLLTVRARKGDPLFQQALANARRDAILAWLFNASKAGPPGTQIQAGTVHVITNHEAENDDVLLELK